MTGITAGYAQVVIKPNFSGFQREMRRNLRTTMPGAGRQISDSLGDSGTQAGAEATQGFKKSFAIGGAVAGIAASITSSLTGAFGGFIKEAAAASDSTNKFASTMDFAGKTKAEIDKATASSKAYADQTVYDLTTVQSTMAQLASNGIKDYDGLTKASGNLNAVAGGNAETFKSVSMTMTQTAGAGKLTSENWNQIADAIPGASGKLQEAMLKNGAFTGNFREAMEKGQISSDEFNKALMQLGSDPVAVEAAKSTKTFEGALGNLQATIVGGLAKALDGMKPMLTGAITGVSNGIGTMITGVSKLGQKMKPGFDLAKKGWGDFKASFSDGESPQLATPFQTASASIGAEMGKTWRSVTDSFGPALKTIGDALAPVIPLLVQAFQSVSPFGLALKVIQPLMPLIAQMLSAIGTALGTILPPIIQVAQSLGNALLPIFTQLISSVLPPLIQTITQIAPIFSQIAQAILPIVTTIVNTLQPVLAQLVPIISQVFTAVLAIVKPVLDVITLLLKGVTWVIQYVLAPILTWLLQNVVMPIFTGIGNVIKFAAGVVTNILNGLVGFFRINLAPVFTWLYNSIIKPVWNGIKTAINVVIIAVKGYINGWIWVFRNVLSPVFTWLLNTIIRPIFNGIRTTISNVITIVTNIFRGIKSFIQFTLAPIFGWLLNTIIRPIFNGIKATISGIWNNGIKPIFENLGSFIKTHVVPAFQKGVDLITNIWKGIANIVRTPINFVIDTVYNNGLKSLFNGIAEKLGMSWRLPDVGSVPEFYKGGHYQGGQAMMGERGAELVKFSDGTWKLVDQPSLVDFGRKGYVYNARKTAAMMNGKAQAPMDALSTLNGGHDEKSSQLPIGGFWGDVWNNVTNTVGKAKDWVVGKIADGVRALVQPVKDGIGGALPGSGINELIRGGAYKLIDDMTNWAVKKDDKKEAEQQAAQAASGLSSYDGPLGRFTRPSAGPFTSMFGASRGKYPHAGIDIAGGGPTYSAWDGVVRKVGTNIVTGRTGIGILIDSGNGLQQYFGHNPVGGVKVKPGDKVKSGQRVGAQGATGNVTGIHLHWETWKNGKPVNPMQFIKGGGGGGKTKASLYDTGGWLTPGTQLISNQTRKPEAIYTNEQNRALQQLANIGSRSVQGGGDTYNISANQAISGQDVANTIQFAQRTNRRR